MFSFKCRNSSLKEKRNAVWRLWWDFPEYLIASFGGMENKNHLGSAEWHGSQKRTWRIYSWNIWGQHVPLGHNSVILKIIFGQARWLDGHRTWHLGPLQRSRLLVLYEVHICCIQSPPSEWNGVNCPFDSFCWLFGVISCRYISTDVHIWLFS